MQTAITRTSGPGRVLLVDDHPAVRRVLRSLLEEVEQLAPDVVLMDCRMPGAGGVAATREIVNRWPEVAVVAHTAYADETYVREMVAAGARGYVLKGDVPAAVLEALSAARQGQAEPAQHERHGDHHQRGHQRHDLHQPDEEGRQRRRHPVGQLEQVGLDPHHGVLGPDGQRQAERERERGHGQAQQVDRRPLVARRLLRGVGHGRSFPGAGALWWDARSSRTPPDHNSGRGRVVPRLRVVSRPG